MTFKFYAPQKSTLEYYMVYLKKLPKCIGSTTLTMYVPKLNLAKSQTFHLAFSSFSSAYLPTSQPNDKSQWFAHNKSYNLLT